MLIFFLALLCVLVRGAALSSVEASPAPISCSDTKAQLDGKKLSKVCSGNTCLYLAYRQASANNQDPVLVRFDGDSQTFCNQKIEDNGDDGLGVGLLWDDSKDYFYGAFTSKGTQPGNQYQDYTSGGWIPNFFGTIAQSSDTKVSVILKINLADGTPTKGTFMGAKLMNNDANTCIVSQMDVAQNEEVAIYFSSFFSPVDVPGSSPANSQRMTCTGKSPFIVGYKFDRDLSAPIEICGGQSCTPNTNLCPSGQLTGVINSTAPGGGGGNGGSGGNGSIIAPALWMMVSGMIIILVAL